MRVLFWAYFSLLLVQTSPVGLPTQQAGALNADPKSTAALKRNVVDEGILRKYPQGTEGKSCEDIDRYDEKVFRICVAHATQIYIFE